MVLLALDVGTTQSGYCMIDEKYLPLKFGKIDNNELLSLVKGEEYSEMVYEEFQSYGMAVGKSTIISITWNGRFMQSALDRGIHVGRVYRKDEKVNLCGNTKAKDANIRMALIDRFAKFDFKTGKGTKNSPDTFYGFKADVWSAYAIGVTYLDIKNGRYQTEGGVQT